MWESGAPCYSEHMARILVIGANSAVAREVARIHAERGDTLALLARNETELGALVKELGASVRFSESADFTDTAGNEARVERAVRALGGLDVALVAHGWLGDQIESEQSVRHAEDVFATNLTSAVSFIVPLANLFEAQRAGSLVVISSVAGDRGRPRNYTYGAAKGALTIYLQGVRSRLYGSGVRVCTIRLGPVDTKMTVDHPKNALFATAPAVARAIVRIETRGSEDAYVPGYWWPIMTAVRNMPERVFQKFGFLAGR